MPGENFSRRVARAAAVGGGRTYRGQTPMAWYGLLLVICVVGVGLITYSRYERTHPTAAASHHAQQSGPPTKSDLWEAGIALDICGKVTLLPASTVQTEAFTTDGHGVMKIEPALSASPSLASGKNAVLNAFLLPEGIVLSDTTLQVPRHQKGSPATTTTSSTPTSTTQPSTSSSSGATTSSTSSTTSTTVAAPPPRTYRNGQTCEGKPGVVRTAVWSSPTASKPKVLTSGAGGLRLENGQLIMLAFVPKSASIPKPPSASKISQFLISNPGGILPPAAAPSTTTPSVATTVPSSSVPTTTSKASKKTSG